MLILTRHPIEADTYSTGSQSKNIYSTCHELLLLFVQGHLTNSPGIFL